MLIKLFTWKENSYTVAKIAMSVGMSISETHAAIKRCEKSGLFSPMTKKPIIPALEEFLIHGLKYCFPAEIGTQDRGLPTAHSAPILSNVIHSKDDMYVWSFPEGSIRGLTVKPLYRSVPLAASRDPLLYDFLALIDAIRLGRIREKKLAGDMLIKLLRNRE